MRNEWIQFLTSFTLRLLLLLLLLVINSPQMTVKLMALSSLLARDGKTRPSEIAMSSSVLELCFHEQQKTRKQENDREMDEREMNEREREREERRKS